MENTPVSLFSSSARTGEIVTDAMRGYHGAVIAYGQTSTGKTHTMQGTPDDPGLIPIAIEECFKYIADEGDASRRRVLQGVSFSSSKMGCAAL